MSRRRCRWINKIQEFNIDVQITKLIRGQGLAKLMAQSNLDANHVNHSEIDYTCDMDDCVWYQDIIYYLRNMKCLDNMDDKKKRTLKLQVIKYVIVKCKLYRQNLDCILLKCVDENQAKVLLNEMHEGVSGGHYMGKTTTQKVLRVGFWWPTIFKDAERLVRRCDACQRFSCKLKFLGNVPLRPVEVQAPFQQWEIDFIGEIANKSSG